MPHPTPEAGHSLRRSHFCLLHVLRTSLKISTFLQSSVLSATSLPPPGIICNTPLSSSVSVAGGLDSASVSFLVPTRSPVILTREALVEMDQVLNATHTLLAFIFDREYTGLACLVEDRFSHACLLHANPDRFFRQALRHLHLPLVRVNLPAL